MRFSRATTAKFGSLLIDGALLFRGALRNRSPSSAHHRGRVAHGVTQNFVRPQGFGPALSLVPAGCSGPGCPSDWTTLPVV
jgi:hypothetical protein